MISFRAKFGDSNKQWPNFSTLLPAAPVLSTFLQYLIAFCKRPEASSDLVSSKCVRPIVLDKFFLKFGDPR